MAKRLTIVGCGALGSHLVQFLRNEDAEIHVIDFDRVEQKNTQSQFHSIGQVRKLKVEALKQTMGFLYKREIKTNSNKLVANNVHALLAASDLIIDCLDNGEARRLVQDYSRAHAVACVHGALAPGGEFGRVTWDEHFVIDDEAGAGVATCEDGAHLPFITLTAAYLARVVQVYLKSNRKVGYQVTPVGAVAV